MTREDVKKYAVLIQLWANGADIEFKRPADGKWLPTTTPWLGSVEYRLKSAPCPRWAVYIDGDYAISYGIKECAIQWAKARFEEGRWEVVELVEKTA